MKIAIASKGNNVDQHFGHSEGFTIYDVKETSQEKRFIENPGHKPGAIPKFLKEQGIGVVISGGMGEKAQKIFSQYGIEVIVGATGSCDDLVQTYLKGELKSTESICREHKHEGHCNN